MERGYRHQKRGKREKQMQRGIVSQILTKAYRMYNRTEGYEHVCMFFRECTKGSRDY